MCKVMVRDLDLLTVRARLMLRIRFRIRTQETPWAELQAVHWFPLRGEIRAMRGGPIMSRVWLPRPGSYSGQATVGPQDALCVPPSEPWRGHDDVPSSTLKNPAPLLGPRCLAI